MFGSYLNSVNRNDGSVAGLISGDWKEPFSSGFNRKSRNHVFGLCPLCSDTHLYSNEFLRTVMLNYSLVSGGSDDN